MDKELHDKIEFAMQRILERFGPIRDTGRKDQLLREPLTPEILLARLTELELELEIEKQPLV